jgi:hypothetical protein
LDEEVSEIAIYKVEANSKNPILLSRNTFNLKNVNDSSSPLGQSFSGVREKLIYSKFDEKSETVVSVTSSWDVIFININGNVVSNESYKKGKQVGYLYGAWNDNSKTDPTRIINVTATNGDYTRTLQINVTIFPTFTINSWQELAT